VSVNLQKMLMQRSNPWMMKMERGLEQAVCILRGTADDSTISCLAEAFVACDDGAVKAELAGELCTTVATRWCDALAAIANGCKSPIWNALAAIVLCLCSAGSEMEYETFSDAASKLIATAMDDTASDPTAEKFIFFALLAKIIQIRF
jgi:hypothetical protein